MTPTFTDHTTVVATTDPISTTLDGEEVILNPETGTYHGLNGIGTKIWGRIQEPTAMMALVASIAEEHDVARDRVRSDVESFLKDLHAAELISLDEQPA